MLGRPLEPSLHHLSVEGGLPVPKGGDSILDGLVYYTNHVSSTVGIALVPSTVSFPPYAIDRSLESKLQETSISLFATSGEERRDGDRPVRVHPSS